MLLGRTLWARVQERDGHAVGVVVAKAGGAAAAGGASSALSARPSADSVLWRYAAPISFEHFAAAFRRKAAHASAHPLLSALLKHEARVAIVRHLPAVLSWHAALFEVGRSRGGDERVLI